MARIKKTLKRFKGRRGKKPLATKRTLVVRSTKRRVRGTKKRIVNAAGFNAVSQLHRDFCQFACDPFCDRLLTIMGVPDAYSGPTLKIVHEFTTVVSTDGSGNLLMGLFPCLPSPFAIFTGVATWTGATSGTTYLIASTPARKTWFGMPLDEYNSVVDLALQALGGVYTTQSGGQGTLNINYNNATQARIIGMGWEFNNDGPVLTTQGASMGARIPWRADTDIYHLDDINNQPNNNALVSTANNNVPMFNVSSTPLSWQAVSGAPNQMSKTGFMVDGGYSVAVRDEATDWSMQNMVPAVQIAITPQGDATAAASPMSWNADWAVATTQPEGIALPLLPTQTGSNASATNYYSGLWPGVGGTNWQSATGHIFATTSHTPLYYAVKQGAPNWPMTVRCRIGVEYVLPQQAPNKNFATPSLAENKHAIAIVANVQKGLPIMVPFAANADGGFGAWVARAIRSVSGMVAGLGIPIVSAAASIGNTIYDSFQSSSTATPSKRLREMTLD